MVRSGHFDGIWAPGAMITVLIWIRKEVSYPSAVSDLTRTDTVATKTAEDGTPGRRLPPAKIISITAVLTMPPLSSGRLDTRSRCDLMRNARPVFDRGR